MEIELKPCPFCGYDNVQITTKRSGNNVRTGDLKQVICTRCKARGPVFGSRYEKIPSWYHVIVKRTPIEAEQLACESWNRRVKEDKHGG